MNRMYERWGKVSERWGFSAERLEIAWYFWFKDQIKERFFRFRGNNYELWMMEGKHLQFSV